MTEPEATIFVVDDDPSVRRGLERLLRAAGHRVESFPSAREFLDRAEYDGPRCLVLDVRMPGQSGLDLHDRLVASGRDIPVIFITGHADVPMAVRAMKSGAVDFLPKPFDDSELLGAASQALERDRKRWVLRQRHGDAI
jgi:FixJ family two-component response regulator